MPYLLLVMEPKGQRKTRTEEEGRQLFERMVRWGEELKARGLFRASESLHTEGVRVQVRGGKRSVSDGPFAEAKELVGGFFLLDCKSREEAIALAHECPAAEWATVEVREVAPCFVG